MAQAQYTGRTGGPPRRDGRGEGSGRRPSAAPAVIVVVLASLLLSAHFLRSFALPFTVAYVLLPWMLAVRRPWAVRVVQAALVLGVFEWITTTVSLLGERRVTGEPAGRMLLIMGGVTAFTALAALVLETAGPRRRYGLRTGRVFQTGPREIDRGEAGPSAVGARPEASGPLSAHTSGLGPYSEDLVAVAAFSQVFDRPDFVAGSWHHPEAAADGSLQMSYWEPSGDVRRWHDSLYQHGMVLPDLDWAAPDWREAMIGFEADPSALAAADLDTVRKVLTTAARADRFNEGYLGSLFESGLVQAATRRLGDLAAGR